MSNQKPSEVSHKVIMRQLCEYLEDKRNRITIKTDEDEFFKNWYKRAESTMLKDWILEDARLAFSMFEDEAKEFLKRN